MTSYEDTYNNLIPKELLSKEIFLTFISSYLEDGIYPEYEFHKAFYDENDAKNEFNKITKSRMSQYDVIIKHKMICDENSYLHFQHNTTNYKLTHLFWNKKYGLWTDFQCFKSVSIEQIISTL